MFTTLLTLTIILKIVEVFSQTDFIVYTNECKIPYFPHLSDEAKEMFIPQNYESCTDSDPLTFTKVSHKKTAAYLHLDVENEVYHNYEKPPTCYYSYVTRNGSEEEPDVGISESEWTYFNTTVELKEDIVKIRCEEDSVVIYENVHNPIRITEPVRKKLREQPIRNENHSPISVLIIVIDSVSRLNFKRTMPLTRAVLLQNKFTEFIAYNKVDDNTFPNCMALLTGMNLKQAYGKCQPTEIGKMDECPMIWYDYRKLGYVTAYAEDWAEISTFNYLKKGFQEPPTDYYFKPYIEAAETLNVTDKDGMPYCTGPETEGERILNLAKDFAVTFKNKPSFGVFWMNTFSHNNINSPSGMDEKIKAFFENLQSEGIFERSMVIVLSDHGIRFGKFRKTIQGWFEERLPVGFISVPTWYLSEPSYQNFVDNSKKLISTYDLYMTLQDVLKRSVSNYTISPSQACPRCQSLFSSITKNRSCRDAGIPEAWCTCVGEFTNEDPRINDDVNKRAVKLAMAEIQKLEFSEPYSTTVTLILSSHVNLNRLRKSYLLLVVQTDTNFIYQILFRIRGEPVEFVRIVKIMRLQ